MIFPALYRRAREAMVRRRPRKKAANHRLALNFAARVFGAHRAERKRRNGRNKDQCAPVFFISTSFTLNSQILLCIGRERFRLVLLAVSDSFRFLRRFETAYFGRNSTDQNEFSFVNN